MTQKISEIHIRNKLMKLASVASVSVAILLIAIKFIAYLITGSVSILAGLFDSIQDLTTSAINLIAVRQSLEPADKEHRFGHGKAQAIGGLLQAFIILFTGLFLMKEAFLRLLTPAPIQEVGIGIGITCVAILITLLLLYFQTYVVKKTDSISIKADRLHYTGDVAMNIGVIASIVCAHMLEWFWVDALFGIGVSLYLLWTAYQIMLITFAVLMDKELPAAFRKEIKKIALSFPQVNKISDLRTRSSGDHAFVQFVIHLDDQLSLTKAHDLIDSIEENIQKKHPNCQIIIHAEPTQRTKKGKKNDFI